MGCWAGAGLGIDFVKIVEKQNPILFFNDFTKSRLAGDGWIVACWAGAGLGVDFMKIDEKQNPTLCSTNARNHVWQEMARNHVHQ